MNRPEKTEAEQVAFFESCYERFLKARDNVGEVNHLYQIANSNVRLVFAGESLVPLLTPALEHLRIPEIDSPGLTLCIWDSDSTFTKMVPPPCDRESFTDRGDIWGFNSCRIKTAFHWIECSVNLMDHSRRTGIFWVQKADTLPYWVHASPLRTLFHWWMERNGCQLLHAAAVGTEDGAVLITGKGGIGKSTTALSCLQEGLYYIADDYLIVAMEPEPIVYTLYSTAKLNADHIQNFPELSNLVQNSEKLDQEKAVMFLYPQFKEQLVTKLSLMAILMPQIADRGDNRLTSLATWRIQRAASFTTMSQLPNAGRHTHDFIGRLSSALPGYTLELGEDLKKIPQTISAFLRDSENHKVHCNKAKIHNAIDSSIMPLVSVIIPVFNGEGFIKEAVENVISQNYPALELIIVDDGSTDRTDEIIEQLTYDIRYFKQENGGPASARNRGIRDASGDLIVFLDVDDFWPENNLEVFVNEMTVDPDLEVVHGYAQLIQYNSEINDYEYIGNPRESFRYYIGAACYRKSAFIKVGLFDTTLMFGEDNDWFYRAVELKVNIKRLEDVTLLVRRHGGNMTEGKDLVELNTLRVFKKHLDRMRVLAARPQNSE